MEVFLSKIPFHPSLHLAVTRKFYQAEEFIRQTTYVSKTLVLLHH